MMGAVSKIDVAFYYCYSEQMLLQYQDRFSPLLLIRLSPWSTSAADVVSCIDVFAKRISSVFPTLGIDHLMLVTESGAEKLPLPSKVDDYKSKEKISTQLRV